METIVPKISSSLSKMWLRVINIENSLFPALKEELRLSELSRKEQKLITILDFAAHSVQTGHQTRLHPATF